MSNTGSSETLVTDELTLRLHQQELVAAFGLFALRETRLSEALQQACDTAAIGLVARYAKVLVYQPDTNDLLLAYGVGWGKGVVGNVVLGTDLASPAGYALRTGKPVVSSHLAEEDRFRTPAVLAEHGIHRAINVIIDGDDGQPFGVLEVDSTHSTAFTVHDTAFLQSIANVLAAAIERCKWQSAQDALLKEKDLLMQEIHHRVRNSLQLVQTMLHLQARNVPLGPERDRLQDASSRIMTIAAVHRRLHQDGPLEQVDAASYLEQLMTDLGHLIAPNVLQRSIEVDAAPIVISADQMAPIGLIATELVTNAMKYGAGRVLVQLRPWVGGVTVCVEDEGTGFAEGIDAFGGGSLGMRLVTALARSPDAVTIDRTVPFGRITVRVGYEAA